MKNTLPDRVRFLAAGSVFSGLDGAAINGIASRCRERSRKPGQDLFLEGDPCRDLYILVSGRVKCFRASPEGREQIPRVFERPGDTFCATSAFSTGSHIVSAQAMTDVRLYVIDVDTIKRVVLDHPVLAMR